MMYIENVTVENRLDNVNVKLPKNKQIHIIGPNGSGKSTFLAAIAGVLPFQGRVELDGINVSELSLNELSKIRSYLAQNEKPVFNITVFEYLRLSLPEHVKQTPVTITNVVNHLVDLLNIRGKLSRSIHQLSGGEWQRVRIVGCCLQIWPELNPDGRLLILDEPSGPLDIGQEKYLYKLLDEVTAQGLTVIMANHDLNRSLRHAEHAVLFSNSELVAHGDIHRVITADNIKSVFHTGVQQFEIEDKRYLVFE
ncbi:vitamin B12 ABC transporter ATP-binding protein BtuD [Vibrio sp.]|nr:vitamin B12 ABC transporter ATP-binding protein BtuD [Vibrio sp.]